MDQLIAVKMLIVRSIEKEIIGEVSMHFMESALSSILESKVTSTAGHVPEELFLDIFKRLPAKPLLRFRCVSSFCNSIISDDSFISTQVNHTFKHTSNNSGMILIRTVNPPPRRNSYKIYIDNESFSECRTIYSPFKLHDGSYNGVGSCNGLLCFYRPSYICCRGVHLQCDPSCIKLWNPATRKSVTLPTASLTGKHKVILGFGFNSKTNDYKVVRLAYLQLPLSLEYMNDTPQVELYDLSVNSWRRLDSVAPSCEIFEHASYAFLHGAVHWVGFGRNAGGECVTSVVLFDFVTESFQQMKLPDASEEHMRDEFLTTLMVSNNTLYFIEYKNSDFYQMYNIWRMEEYRVAESWTKILCVQANMTFPKLLGVRRNGHVLVQVEQGDFSEVLSHDPRTGISTHLGIYGLQSRFYVYSYVESLALLGLDEAMSDEGPDDLTDKEESSEDNKVSDGSTEEELNVDNMNKED